MAPAAVASVEDIPVDVRSVKALQLQQLKRTFDLFAGNYGVKPDVDNNRYADLEPAVFTSTLAQLSSRAKRTSSALRSQEAKLRCKVSLTTPGHESVVQWRADAEVPCKYIETTVRLCYFADTRRI